MKKILVLLVAVMLLIPAMKAQQTASDELGVGLRFQKTEKLYWENGVGLDYTSDFLLKKHIHLKMSYATSRLGSAMIGNAVRQDNILVGADWRFRVQKPLQIFAGLNAGFFHADMEIPAFDILSHNSMLFSAETGLFYKFKFPLATSLSVSYNLINGNGVTGPGTLFPVYYQFSVLYYIKPEARGKQ